MKKQLNSFSIPVNWNNKLRRFLVFPIISIVLISCLSVSAFACEAAIGTKDIVSRYNGIFTKSGDMLVVNPVLPLSACESSVRDSVSNALSLAVSGSDRVILSFSGYTSGTQSTNLNFYVFDSPVASGFISGNNVYRVFTNFTLYSFRISNTSECVLDYSVRCTDSTSPLRNIETGSYLLYASGNFVEDYINKVGAHNCNLNHVFLEYYNTYDSFSISDDLDEDPEPTPAPTTIPTPKPIAPPVVPPGNEYVPYRTDIWNTFFNHVSGNAGAIANIGLLIFAVWFAWFLIPKIVKWFTKSR